jgi:RNA polymerase sigma factor (sigma-70 family)
MTAARASHRSMSEEFSRCSASPRNFEPLVEAARGGDEHGFRALIEPLGRELHAYAYRMLGGFHDADDALQDAQLKAWRALATYEPRASFRAWMYRIVTNTCLDMLKARSRRVLPQDVGPSIAPGPPTTAPRSDILWLEPYPDALLPAVPGPEQAVRLREGIRLAFVRVVQVLPPRQRAALILHDVLDWSVAEVAGILESTEAAINSALQRARAAIAYDLRAAGAVRGVGLPSGARRVIAGLRRAATTGRLRPSGLACARLDRRPSSGSGRLAHAVTVVLDLLRFDHRRADLTAQARQVAGRVRDQDRGALRRRTDLLQHVEVLRHQHKYLATILRTIQTAQIARDEKKLAKATLRERRVLTRSIDECRAGTAK